MYTYVRIYGCEYVVMDVRCLGIDARLVKVHVT